MSTINVTTLKSANGSTDLTLASGNTSAGNIVIPASGSSILANREIAVNDLTNYGQFRSVQGNYGVFWRNDGSNFYLLSTSSGNQYGAWNANRPFYYDMVNNLTYLGSTTTSVLGNLTVSGTTTLSSTLSIPGDISFNSGYGSAAVAYGVRVWVSFNGNNGSIYGSRGVTSVTRNNAGDYTINFNFTMPDATYAVSGSGMEVNGLASGGSYQSAFSLGASNSILTTSCRIQNANVDGGNNVDGAYVHFIAVR
jgi:hypothetical protein